MPIMDRESDKLRVPKISPNKFILNFMDPVGEANGTETTGDDAFATLTALTVVGMTGKLFVAIAVIFETKLASTQLNNKIKIKK